MEDQTALIREFIQRQEDFNEAHSRNMEKLMRGLYGEEENNTIGLVARVVDTEKKIKKHENLHKRVAWMAGGFMFSLEGIWHTIKTFFIDK